jgi:hypothetical protein
MSTITSYNVTRAGVPVGGVQWVQLDLMSQADARAYGGASAGEGPYFRYTGYMPSLIVLLQGDLLTDTQNNDPLTGVHKKFRVIGDPEPFANGHTEFVCDRVIGT